MSNMWVKYSGIVMPSRRQTVLLITSLAVGTIVPFLCVLWEYHPAHFIHALQQQLQRFVASKSDVDQLLAAVITQVLLAVLCFGVGHWFKRTAPAWYVKPTVDYLLTPVDIAGSINQAPSSDKPSTDKANNATQTEKVGVSAADDEEESDEELIASMNHLLRSFPRTTRFRYLFGTVITLCSLTVVYSLVKLLLVLNHTSNAARWTLILFTFSWNCVQFSQCSIYIKELDTDARESVKKSAAEDSKGVVRGHVGDVELREPLLGSGEDKHGESELKIDVGSLLKELPSYVRSELKPMSTQATKAARRLKRKLAELKKHRKDAKERKVDLKKAASNMTRIAALSKPDVSLLLVGFVFLVLSAVASALIPKFTGSVVDNLHTGGGASQATHKFKMTIVYLLLAGTAAGVFGGLRGAVLMVCLARLKVRVRELLFGSIVKQEIGFFDQTQTGDVTSRLVADTTNSIALNINIFLRSLIQCVGVIVFMFVTSWKLSILTCILIPMLVLVSQVYGKYVRQVAEDTQSSVANSTKVAEEVVSSMSTVRSFANEPIE